MSDDGNGSHPGFRRWHERRLFLSFAWLTTCILCGVVIAAVLEFVVLPGSGATMWAALIVVYLVGLMAVDAWRRFWIILSHAQQCANQATCAECGAYGLFPVPGNESPIPARCRQCAHRWTIE